MPALSRQQRARRIGLEQRVDDADRVEDQRIVGAAQSEADELQKVGANKLVTRDTATIGYDGSG